MKKTDKEIGTRDSLPLRFGQFADGFIASEYALAAGLYLATHNSAVIHAQYEYMRGHIDRFVLDKDIPLMSEDGCINASRILECKTANLFAQSDWGNPGGDQVPLSCLVQCFWYMMLTNIDRTDLAVLFGNAGFRIYEITPDLELEQMALERAVSFWENHVLADIPPAATSESYYKTLFGKSAVSKLLQRLVN